MTTKWRPEGWKNPYDATSTRKMFPKATDLELAINQRREEGYEEGADAMLEALQPDRIDIVGNLHEIRLDLICKLPVCYSRIAGEHGYCQEHYERLNKVT